MLLMLARKEETKHEEQAVASAVLPVVFYDLVGPLVAINIPGIERDFSLPKKLGYGVCTSSCCLKPGSQAGSYT